MKLSVLLLTAFALSLTTVMAFAQQGRFARRHPRRAEVLRRDRNEMSKNRDAAADGEITKGQEHELNAEDRAIRRQEQADARADGGHITKAEQRQLNREENRVNRQRRRMERRDAGGAQPSTTTPASAPATSN